MPTPLGCDIHSAKCMYTQLILLSQPETRGPIIPKWGLSLWDVNQLTVKSKLFKQAVGVSV